MPEATPEPAPAPDVASKPASSRRVTLSMVADEVGLGVTTVSDILNRGAGDRYADDTRRRVESAVERLGYTPSRAAQSTRSGRSGVVGLLLTRDFSNPFWARFADTTEKALRRRGYFAQLGVCDGDPETETRHMQRLLGDRAEGLIIGPIYEEKDLRSHGRLVGGLIPTVVFGSDGVTKLDTVDVDVEANGELIAGHLAARGHRRVALLGDPAEDPLAYERSVFHAIEAALAAAGRPVDRSWIFPQRDRGRSEDAYATAAAFAHRFKQTVPEAKPTAVVCHNDQFAAAALCAFDAAGLRVPEELSVIGHDNLPESRFTIPPLTTLDSKTDADPRDRRLAAHEAHRGALAPASGPPHRRLAR